MAHKSHRKHLKHVHEHEQHEHEEMSPPSRAASFVELGRALATSVKEAAFAVPRAVIGRVLRRPRAILEKFSGMYSSHRATAK